MATGMFIPGAYLNLYVADGCYMYRFWYRAPVPTVLESAHCPRLVQNTTFTDPQALKERIVSLVQDEDFSHGEYLNYAHNQTYQRIHSVDELCPYIFS
jgi:hypothetical protein